MDNIKRSIQPKIEKELYQGKVIVVYGPRQAGKTTLIREIEKKYLSESVYLSCDEPDIRSAFTNATSSAMKAFIGNNKLVFLDEAQRVANIGLSLKLLHDTFPEIQVVATGSSSFDLANSISEPLTGRKREFFLPPISAKELGSTIGKLDMERTLEQRLVFGMYPEVIVRGSAEAKETLAEIASSYLYKDILSYERLRHPDLLEKILRALALQIGQEVSYTELATTVGVNKQTVERYVELLEKTFVIFRVPPLHRNRRKEIGKLRKIFFWDTGVRNQLIGAWQELSARADVGVLWENFLMSERYKLHAAALRPANRFFWRSYDQHEIDYVEEMEGKLTGFEFKWTPAPYRPPKTFVDLYPAASVALVSRKNWLDFCVGEPPFQM